PVMGNLGGQYVNGFVQGLEGYALNVGGTLGPNQIEPWLFEHLTNYDPGLITAYKNISRGIGHGLTFAQYLNALSFVGSAQAAEPGTITVMPGDTLDRIIKNNLVINNKPATPKDIAIRRNEVLAVNPKIVARN